MSHPPEHTPEQETKAANPITSVNDIMAILYAPRVKAQFPEIDWEGMSDQEVMDSAVGIFLAEPCPECGCPSRGDHG